MRRLPSRHVFPGGFVVDIVLGTPDEGNAAEYETVERGRGRITLSSNRTPRQQWRDLAHELIHATVDAQNHIEQVVAR